MAEIPQEQVVRLRAELGSAVVVRPGDKLVIAMSDMISMEQAVTMKARLAEQLPGVEGVVIDGCTGLAVYRDEPDGILHVNHVLSEEEVRSLRERGVIGEDGKTTGDRLAEWFEEKTVNGS